MYEVAITADNDPIRTGSLWQRGAAAAFTKDLAQPGEWLTLEAIAVGNHITVKVNGQTTADWHDPNSTYNTGSLALQQYTGRTEVQFRKIEIKELSAAVTQIADAPFDAKGASEASDRVTDSPETPAAGGQTTGGDR
jgi:hypothetical protein